MLDDTTQQASIHTPLMFPRFLPGFYGEQYRHGALVRGSGPVMSLRVGADARLPVIVPYDADPEFGFRFHPQDTIDLGSQRNWTIVCVINLPTINRRATINRFAPIVINENGGVAAQVINRVPGYSTRDHLEVMA
jgi:flagellar assembly factor FliW